MQLKANDCQLLCWQLSCWYRWLPVPSASRRPERVQVKGEVIDTWCYFSGVMGGPESVVGSAHHTCALWCAAGGIPVGILADDGTVYMVIKWEGRRRC